jgi:lactose/L-arabinose transport system permease protein
MAITWRWTGYNMIFYLAAMQNIDKSIYEAARIDGISAPALPLDHRPHAQAGDPVHDGDLDHRHLAAVRRADEHHERADPDVTLTLSLYIYNLSFRYVPNFGYAATVSYVIVGWSPFWPSSSSTLARERD